MSMYAIKADPSQIIAEATSDWQLGVPMAMVALEDVTIGWRLLMQRHESVQMSTMSPSRLDLVATNQHTAILKCSLGGGRRYARMGASSTQLRSYHLLGKSLRQTCR